jgi:ferrous iron transport protein B
MELPPYRAPTLRGLLIHTWERTWQYVKKAGTVILAFSVILWAMMTFPRLPDEQIQIFDQEMSKVTSTFFSRQPASHGIQDEAELNVLKGLYDRLKRGESVVVSSGQNDTLLSVARTALRLGANNGKTTIEGVTEEVVAAAALFLTYRQRMAEINSLEQEAALKGTIAGWLGRKLAVITRPLGFEYRTNIALVGGFAAKEVIISTLGTAYSLSDGDEAASLPAKLQKDPAWNPLQGFVLIIFIMLYVPCVATVASIRKESSWKWAAFSIFFNLVVAYGISFLIRQGGLFLGMGG